MTDRPDRRAELGHSADRMMSAMMSGHAYTHVTGQEGGSRLTVRTGEEVCVCVFWDRVAVCVCVHMYVALSRGIVYLCVCVCVYSSQHATASTNQTHM